MAGTSVALTAVPGIPMIEPGDDLGAILAEALKNDGMALQARDVVVIAQKVVSKAEGRYRLLDEIEPSSEAVALAGKVHKDPRHVEAILRESAEVVRHREGLLITAHRLGYVMANAGIDQSNIAQSDGERLLLLPEDPDASCARLKRALDAAFAADVAVVMNDSFGRAWRNGVVGVALGAAGLPSLRDLVGTPDLFGRPMRVTEVALADEIASAASLVMGQGAEGLPVVHIRGLAWEEAPRPARDLVRPKHRDLFR